VKICDHAEDCLCNAKEACEHYIPHDEGDDCGDPQVCYWPQGETVIVKCVETTEVK
jgi:hypothetical protein